MASLKKKLWLEIIRNRPSDWLKLVWRVLPGVVFVSLIVMAVNDFNASDKYGSPLVIAIKVLELICLVIVLFTGDAHNIFWPLFRPIYEWMVLREGLR